MPRKLGRTTDHRMAMLRAMVTFLLENGKIETTVTRAKEVRPIAEKMVTLGKKGTLAARRQVMAFVTKEDVVVKLFDQIFYRIDARAFETVEAAHGQIELFYGHFQNLRLGVRFPVGEADLDDLIGEAHEDLEMLGEITEEPNIFYKVMMEHGYSKSYCFCARWHIICFKGDNFYGMPVAKYPCRRWPNEAKERENGNIDHIFKKHCANEIYI